LRGSGAVVRMSPDGCSGGRPSESEHKAYREDWISMSTVNSPFRDQASDGSSVTALCKALVERGLCDAKTIDRATRVAEESGQRVDRVLT